MYARVVSAKVTPEQIAQSVELQALGESLAACAMTQPGNCGFFGLVDRSTGHVMTVTLWATPQDLEASETNGYLRRQLAHAQALVGGPVTRQTFEVVAHCEVPEAVASS